MQNNIYTVALNKIVESNYILLLTHKNPDPDTLGSALALGSYLQSIQKKYKVYNVSKSAIPRKLEFLNGVNKITEQLPKSYDLVIYLDCSEDYMVGTEINKDIFSIVIDHHKTSEKSGDILLLDEKSASTGEVVFDFFEKNEISISKDMATSLYVSIFSDTVGFTTPRVNAKTFEKLSKLAATGIDPSFIANRLNQQDSLAKYRALPKVLESLELHCEGKIATVYCEELWIEQSGVELGELDFVSNMILNIAIVETVAYFRKVDNKIRVSLRGKGNSDLTKIASVFDGGGHKNAAGFNLEVQTVQEAKECFLSTLKNHTFD